MRTHRTARTREAFIEALRASGNVTDSAAAANIGRSEVYLWRREDPEFAEQWEAALELGIQALEDVATRYATAGNDRLLMFLLQANRPDKYQPRQKLDVTSQSTVSIEIRRQPLDLLRAELAEILAPRPAVLALDAPSEQSDGATVVPLYPNPTGD